MLALGASLRESLKNQARPKQQKVNTSVDARKPVARYKEEAERNVQAWADAAIRAVIVCKEPPFYPLHKGEEPTQIQEILKWVETKNRKPKELTGFVSCYWGLPFVIGKQKGIEQITNEAWDGYHWAYLTGPGFTAMVKAEFEVDSGGKMEVRTIGKADLKVMHLPEKFRYAVTKAERDAAAVEEEKAQKETETRKQHGAGVVPAAASSLAASEKSPESKCSEILAALKGLNAMTEAHLKDFCATQSKIKDKKRAHSEPILRALLPKNLKASLPKSKDKFEPIRAEVTSVMAGLVSFIKKHKPGLLSVTEVRVQEDFIFLLAILNYRGRPSWEWLVLEEEEGIFDPDLGDFDPFSESPPPASPPLSRHENDSPHEEDEDDESDEDDEEEEEDETPADVSPLWEGDGKDDDEDPGDDSPPKGKGRGGAAAPPKEAPTPVPKVSGKSGSKGGRGKGTKQKSEGVKESLLRKCFSPCSSRAISNHKLDKLGQFREVQDGETINLDEVIMVSGLLESQGIGSPFLSVMLIPDEEVGLAKVPAPPSDNPPVDVGCGCLPYYEDGDSWFPEKFSEGVHCARCKRFSDWKDCCCFVHHNPRWKSPDTSQKITFEEVFLPLLLESNRQTAWPEAVARFQALPSAARLSPLGEDFSTRVGLSTQCNPKGGPLRPFSGMGRKLVEVPTNKEVAVKMTENRWFYEQVRAQVIMAGRHQKAVCESINSIQDDFLQSIFPGHPLNQGIVGKFANLHPELVFDPTTKIISAADSGRKVGNRNLLDTRNVAKRVQAAPFQWKRGFLN